MFACVSFSTCFSVGCLAGCPRVFLWWLDMSEEKSKCHKGVLKFGAISGEVYAIWEFETDERRFCMVQFMQIQALLFCCSPRCSM